MQCYIKDRRNAYRRLGDYIREVDVRNKDLKVTRLFGLSIDKAFIPSVANVIGTDLSNYKVVYKGQFASNFMHVGRDEKIPIAMYELEEPIIVSPAYFVFEVIDIDILLPSYLMMWLQRTDFDRQACFFTDGDVRGGLSKDAFLNMTLPIPPIARQREIVSEYAMLVNRIRLNNRLISTLESTAQALYRKMFVDNIDKNNLPTGWRMGTIGEYATVKSGFAFNSTWWQKSGIPVIKIGNISNLTIDDTECDYVDEQKMTIAENYIAKEGDIVIAMTGATLGKIAIISKGCFLVNQRVGLFDLGDSPINTAAFLYVLLQQDFVQNDIFTVGGDSAQANVSNNDIEKISIPFPPQMLIDKFNQCGKVVLNHINAKHQENKKLTELQSLLLTKMGE